MQYISRGHKGIEIFQNKINNGYAKGNNFGVRKACEIFEPDFLAIMNPDVRINDRQIIVKLLKAFSKNAKVALATGFMLDVNRKLSFNKIAWKIPKGVDDFFLNIFLLKCLYNPIAYRRLKLSKDGLFYVEVVPGSLFIIRRKIFEKINMFDEKTFLTCEERILGYKLKKEGYKSVLVPNCFFFHNHPKKEYSLSERYKSYFVLIKSRFYYNLVYNLRQRYIILPIFIFSVLFGFIEQTFIYLIKKIIRRV